ncbi:uncharacterized protein BJX67DRAFT_109637 [Aspergillus lucknowensis]|uniref:Uncharacterized protein n=1 Tax=Aspergillus lucknowensis TaxID=176173 RepID=A0ABR4LR19_9EURO
MSFMPELEGINHRDPSCGLSASAMMIIGSEVGSHRQPSSPLLRIIGVWNSYQHQLFKKLLEWNGTPRVTMSHPRKVLKGESSKVETKGPSSGDSLQTSEPPGLRLNYVGTAISPARAKGAATISIHLARPRNLCGPCCWANIPIVDLNRG